MKVNIVAKNGVYYLYDECKRFLGSEETRGDAEDEAKRFETIFSEELIKLKEA